jgi:putative protease
MNKIEIMAPAGSFEALAAAIKAGADSVYFGAGLLNMRARSVVNFSLDDLARIARKCKKSGVKSYLTLNVVVFDSEMEQIKTVCDAAVKAGISAVIASDIAVIKYAHSIGLPVHISVQANICNLEAVKFFAQYADVMVLARELSLAQIKYIIDGIERENITGPSGGKVRVEIFAHGALCVSFSGKCYMSLGTHNASANRGVCVQNCRRKYRVTDEKTGEELVIDNHNIMSPKDLCTIRFLDQILNSGVAILKLEGRGRSADYVYTVTKCYREAAEAWQSNSYTGDKIKRWLEELDSVFNRGFWHGGYYLGEKLGEWCEDGGSRAKKMKVHLGRVSKYFSKIGVAELEIDAGDLNAGQQLLVTGKTTGAFSFAADEIRCDGKNIDFAPKGSIISVAVPGKVRMNDLVYLLVERVFGQEIDAAEEL